jgi:predicted Co/Zn/Cd cation transporter (cation efflux family)
MAVMVEALVLLVALALPVQLVLAEPEVLLAMPLRLMDLQQHLFQEMIQHMSKAQYHDRCTT